MNRWLFVGFVLSTFGLFGCFFGDEAELSPSERAALKQQQDIDGLRDEIVRLEGNRTPFLSKFATELSTTRHALNWIDIRREDPTLHRWDARTEEQVHYTFSIGPSNRYNYRSDDEFVVTAQDLGEGVSYMVYDANKVESLVGTFTLPTPRTEARWWAYDVEGGAVYVLIEGETHQLKRWTPSTQTLEHLFTLEERGIQVGIFSEFKVWKNTLMLIESGRAWALDLDAGEPIWFPAEEKVTLVSFDESGVVFGQPTKGLMFYDLNQLKIRRLDEEIKGLEWSLNDTFKNVHLWRGGRALKHKDWVVYESSYGIWAYHLKDRTLRPVLLNSHGADVRVVYRQHVLLEDCTMIVKGLESEDDAVGANGPIYLVSTGL